MRGLFTNIPFRLLQTADGGEAVEVEGKVYRLGRTVYVEGGSVWMRTGYPGQPDRAIAGPARVTQNWIILVVGLVMAACGVVGTMLGIL